MSCASSLSNKTGKNVWENEKRSSLKALKKSARV